MEAPRLTSKKFMKVFLSEKVMAFIFWDSQGVIMVDYLEESRTLADAYYVEELLCFRHISESRFLLGDLHRRSKFANFCHDLMQNHLS